MLFITFHSHPPTYGKAGRDNETASPAPNSIKVIDHTLVSGLPPRRYLAAAKTPSSVMIRLTNVLGNQRGDWNVSYYVKHYFDDVFLQLAIPREASCHGSAMTKWEINVTFTTRKPALISSCRHSNYWKDMGFQMPSFDYLRLWQQSTVWVTGQCASHSKRRLNLLVSAKTLLGRCCLAVGTPLKRHTDVLNVTYQCHNYSQGSPVFANWLIHYFTSLNTEWTKT